MTLFVKIKQCLELLNNTNPPFLAFVLYSPGTFDHDLTELYGVENRVLRQTVRRNSDKFPDDTPTTLPVNTSITSAAGFSKLAGTPTCSWRHCEAGGCSRCRPQAPGRNTQVPQSTLWAGSPFPPIFNKRCQDRPAGTCRVPGHCGDDKRLRH